MSRRTVSLARPYNSRLAWRRPAAPTHCYGCGTDLAVQGDRYVFASGRSIPTSIAAGRIPCERCWPERVAAMTSGADADGGAL
jgi:hypothetical protein